MKQTFINTLTKLADRDKNIYLLTGDLGFSVFENFAKKFPKRFINCGVAEQNMLGVAAGLALSGKKVYVYSIIPFVTMRCFEQIRNDICYQNLDVKIIGVGSGFAYGSLGTTHHSIEDMAILKTLPNIMVLCPADPTETRELILKSYRTKRPTFMRLGRGGEKMLYNNRPNIIIGRPSVLKRGKDGVIITTGNYLEVGINIIKKLEQEGYNFTLMSMHTLKPINVSTLINELQGQKLIFTMEEHNLIGGLGSSISEIFIDYNLNNVLIRRIGVDDKRKGIIGDQYYLRKYYKIDEDSIYKQIISCLEAEDQQNVMKSTYPINLGRGITQVNARSIN